MKTDFFNPGQNADQRVKILVAEDNDINQKLFQLLFKKLGYSISIASNGVEAIEMTDLQKWDLIFMDIEMPGMGGVEACNHIKSKWGTMAPPIIAVTANAIDGDREKYLNEGMDDYIPKPIKLNDLEKCIADYTAVIY